MLQASPAPEYAPLAPCPERQVGTSVLLYLLLGRLARIHSSSDRLDFCVDVCPNAEFLALLTVFDIKELVTHVLGGHGAETSALFTRSYGTLGSWPPAGYFLAPCRVKLDRLTSPT